MAEDFAERLREIAIDAEDWVLEAADEIDRLRDIIVNFYYADEFYYDTCQPDYERPLDCVKAAIALQKHWDEIEEEAKKYDRRYP